MAGAGAVITKNVLPFAVMMGNPAQQTGWISQDGHRLSFQAGTAFCAEEKQVYTLINNQVQKL